MRSGGFRIALNRHSLKASGRLYVDIIRLIFIFTFIYVPKNALQSLLPMRNKCVAAASGDYIIEVDGDVIMHPLFVKDHCDFAQEGFYLKGGRANLGPGLTDRMCADGRLRRIRYWTRGIESKRENSIHSRLIAGFLAPRYRKHLTAQFSRML